MTLQVLIIGNSHVAALSLGWQQLCAEGLSSDMPDVAFFAMPSAIYKTFGFVDTCFGAHKSLGAPPLAIRRTRAFNGVAHVDLSRFDHLLLAGHNWGLGTLLNRLRHHDIEGLRHAGADRPRLSSAFFDAIAHSWMESTAPANGWFDPALPPLTVLQRPRASAKARDLPEGARGLLDSFGPSDEGCAFGKVVERIDTLCAALLEARGARLLRQPAETRTGDGLTEARFSRGSRRLRREEEHPETDLYHMNADFGTLCLRDWFALISQESGSAAQPRGRKALV